MKSLHALDYNLGINWCKNWEFFSQTVVYTLGCLPIFKNIFKQNGEKPNESRYPKDLKSKISEVLAQK